MATYYADAPEVEQIAAKLIEKYPELHECQEAKVKYLFKVANKSDRMGNCGLATGKWKYLTDYDYVIEMWDKSWDGLSVHQREALTYHELRHIKKTVKEKDGEITVKWKTYKHTYELFLRELLHYGAWSPHYQELFDAIKEMTS